MPTYPNGASGGAVRAILNDTGLRKNNYSATTSPTVNDDATQGYEIGSEWADNTVHVLWVAFGVAPGAADWRRKLTSDTPTDVTPVSSIANTDRILTLDSTGGPQSAPAASVVRTDGSILRDVVLTNAAWVALPVKDANTRYTIVG